MGAQYLHGAGQLLLAIVSIKSTPNQVIYLTWKDAKI